MKPGFDPENVLVMGVSLPGTRYPRPEQQRQASEDLIARIGALPSVTSVGTTTQLPLSGQDDWIGVGVEGRPNESANEEPSAAWRAVNIDFFKTMRIPVKRGRTFQPSDARISVPLIRWYPQQPYPARFNEAQAAPVAVINETMAQHYWPGIDPIGKRFRFLESPYITVIGVVGDIKHRGLGMRASPEVYLSTLQEPENWANVLVRTSGDPMAVAGAVRSAVRAFDKDLPVERVSTMNDIRAQSVGDARLNAGLLGAFGLLALVMAVVGIYGVISYSVAQRTHEIGIRSAIGASNRDVVRLILGRAMTLTSIGVLIGAGGALALTRVLERLLFEVKPSDPATFVTMSVVLGAVALAASYIPVRRALRVDPVEALRRP